MKRYRAIASGAWSDLAIWEDDGGGSFQASTTLPAIDDEVYTNGFAISLASGTYQVALISNGESSNQENEPVVVGGYLNMANDSNKTCNFIADFYNYSSIIIYAGMTGNRAHTISIVGNCYNLSGIFVEASSGVNGRSVILTITGNVYSHGGVFLQIAGTGTVVNRVFTINGNVDANSSQLLNTTGSTGSVVINGNLTKSGGSIGTTNSGRFVNGTFYATGQITQSLEISNGEIINAFWLSAGYTATNISKYRVIIDNVEWYLPEEITNWLPSTSDVRDGVQFGLDNSFVGTLDLPQEANVLLGVTYDNGNKTGTYNVSISPADITSALTSYGTAKSSEITNVVKEEYLAEILGE